MAICMPQAEAGIKRIDRDTIEYLSFRFPTTEARCNGGGNNGKPCAAPSDCSGGTCNPSNERRHARRAGGHRGDRTGRPLAVRRGNHRLCRTDRPPGVHRRLLRQRRRMWDRRPTREASRALRRCRIPIRTTSTAFKMVRPATRPRPLFARPSMATATCCCRSIGTGILVRDQGIPAPRLLSLRFKSPSPAMFPLRRSGPRVSGLVHPGRGTLGADFRGAGRPDGSRPRRGDVLRLGRRAVHGAARREPAMAPATAARATASDAPPRATARTEAARRPASMLRPPFRATPTSTVRRAPTSAAATCSTTTRSDSCRSHAPGPPDSVS